MKRNQWKSKAIGILQGKWRTSVLCFTVVCLVQMLGAWIGTGANTLLPVPKMLGDLIVVNRDYIIHWYGILK